ncbi:uncharacterized protein [Haliotis cracherodii]|uniref:uncharacterized protein n=1 Tax=Haliotis cracherodii TaxID=6455 RepID=UPI0039ED3DCC
MAQGMKKFAQSAHKSKKHHRLPVRKTGPKKGRIDIAPKKTKLLEEKKWKKNVTLVSYCPLTSNRPISVSAYKGTFNTILSKKYRRKPVLLNPNHSQFSNLLIQGAL